MFENFDLDTIGYIQYMEQAEKEKQESNKSGKEQKNDIRLSQNEYNRRGRTLTDQDTKFLKRIF